MVFNELPEGHPLRQGLDKKTEFDITYDEYWETADPKLKDDLKQKMFNYATTDEQLRRLLGVAVPGSDFEREIKEKIEALSEGQKQDF